MRTHGKISQCIVGCVLLVLLVSACAAQIEKADTGISTTAADGTQFSDPFAYCASVTTIDTPDNRYTGPSAPDAIIEALRQEAGISSDAPVDWVAAGSVWRCMDGKVWGCFVGANLPCSEKADTSATPGPEMQDFCEQNPDADVIPAVVTGRATVYEWRCEGNTPTAGQQLLTPDARGFLSDFWYELGEQ